MFEFVLNLDKYAKVFSEFNLSRKRHCPRSIANVQPSVQQIAENTVFLVSSIPALTIVIIVLVELITKKREENSTCRCNERQENTARDIGDKSWIEPALLQN